ncbi:hypothetical protein BDR03DRAFT_1008550 [Suillus americanus]|nr:hypothetical protein BDR03DRAFT_1008550 [Suillus americanus]
MTVTFGFICVSVSLLHCLQRHEHTFHHLYLQPSHSSIETTATTVSLSTPALPVSILKMKPKPKEKDGLKTMKPKPICRNLVQNPSMFGPELPCPQATSLHLPRILLSSPVAVSLASSMTASLSMPATPSMHSSLRGFTHWHADAYAAFVMSALPSH